MKRKRKGGACYGQHKRLKGRHDDGPFEQSTDSSQPSHPVLKCYYRHTPTLRQYLLAYVPRIADDTRASLAREHAHSFDAELETLLDTVVVAFNDLPSAYSQRAREQDLASFSQQLPQSTIGSGAVPGKALQLEVLDFVVWLLFRRNASSGRPQHLLCKGYERASSAAQNDTCQNGQSIVPGILYRCPNENIIWLRGNIWSQLLSTLGRGADLIMIDMLLDCSLFKVLEGSNSLSQFSGLPLSSCALLSALQPPVSAPLPTKIGFTKPGNCALSTRALRKPSEIRFVRSRMFYGKPALKSEEAVRLGLRHIHVFNRLPNTADLDQTLHITKYIFPRQFGLHNVFTSNVNPRQTAHTFQDYTLREQEILRAESTRALKSAPCADDRRMARVPKRIRGDILQLVGRIRTRHSRCSYLELLYYYCPVPEPLPNFTDRARQNLQCPIDYATDHSKVFAFCRAVFLKILPNNVFGDGDAGVHNHKVFAREVHKFIIGRKGESSTLHEVLQGFKIADICWLAPKLAVGCKMSRTDFEKRKELFAEFIYYLFDSFLMPLVKSNFHVTESNVHKNRLFYFRQDVWKTLTEPTLLDLKSKMFEEIPLDKCRRMLAERKLGYSLVRLLPKASGFRQIINLKRRQLVWQGGKKMLGRSINSTMTPVFRVLNYEKTLNPATVGCSLFSVGDLYPRLSVFAAELQATGVKAKPLYFAKVDVQSCFDTLPQCKVIAVVNALLTEDDYRLDNFAVVKPPRFSYDGTTQLTTKPQVRYLSKAAPAGRENNATGLEPTRSDAVLVGSLGQQTWRRREVTNLLQEHINGNIVRFGKKYYKQKHGIPQGSILSSLLCNFFYGRLEQEVLSRFQQSHSLLVRLIDDFLLISTERAQAEMFLRVMYKGIPGYGVSVKPEKSLVNFDLAVDGQQVPRTRSNMFPYCGLLIDTRALCLLKDDGSKAHGNIPDSLTVESSAIPGKTFRRKALNALKIQLHVMFFDTQFNSIQVVLWNLYASYYKAGLRCFHYARGLRGPKRATSSNVMKATIEDLCKLGMRVMHRKRRPPAGHGRSCATVFECTVGYAQNAWICSKAFSDVFQKRQTGQGEILAWLEARMSAAWRRACRSERATLETLVVERLRP